MCKVALALTRLAIADIVQIESSSKYSKTNSQVVLHGGGFLKQSLIFAIPPDCLFSSKIPPSVSALHNRGINKKAVVM